MDASAARILDAAIHALRAEILPQLGDEAIRIRFDQITRLLNGVSARISRREEGLRQMAQTAAGIGIDAPALPAAPSLAQLEQQRLHIDAAISARIPQLLEAAAQGREGIQALERVVDLGRQFFLSQDADIAAGSQVVYRGGRIESAERADERETLTEASLGDYLRQRFDRSTLRATNLRAIPGGFSKQTFFFTQVDDASGASEARVIRKDMPVPFMDKSVTAEFDLLRNLHARGFPVAPPLWLETDAALFGGCFIVSERVPGSSDAASWSADPQRADRACRELARVLAKLHAYDPLQLGCPPSQAALSAGELMEQEIDHWIRLFHARRAEPLPLQELPLVWLRRNIPAALYNRPGRVVHGDAGFHNLMFDDDGNVSALLDWEFSTLGDPTQDLCFVRLFVEPLMNWEQFIDLYLSSGGVEPCREAGFFFDLWSKTRNAIGCVDARALFDTVMPDEVKFALAGHVFAPYLFIDECESLLAHLRQGG